MKKKILIVISGLSHGGVNKSLMNLLGVINTQKYSFDIFPIYRVGPYNELLRGYNIITLEEFFPFLNLVHKASKRRENTINKITDFCTKIGIHVSPKLVSRNLGTALSKRNYDIVVSFQEGFTTVFASYIQAAKHIAWVHCDYSRYIAKTHIEESEIYKHYDYIIAVSEYTASIFRNSVPTVANKVLSIPNIIDQNYIETQSVEQISDCKYNEDGFIIISVGRLDPVKRFSSIPIIAKQLKMRKIPFRWYIIGDGGSEKRRVISAIKVNAVEQEVILLGAKDNPYPYIRKASILVCPSFSEACPNVVHEGKVLHVPVVAADFPSAIEYINNGENGYITSIEKMPDIIEMLYLNKNKYECIRNYLMNYRYDNNQILVKLDKIFS